jgi:hypothetical protein
MTAARRQPQTARLTVRLPRQLALAASEAAHADGCGNLSEWVRALLRDTVRTRSEQRRAV